MQGKSDALAHYQAEKCASEKSRGDDAGQNKWLALAAMMTAVIAVLSQIANPCLPRAHYASKVCRRAQRLILGADSPPLAYCYTSSWARRACLYSTNFKAGIGAVFGVTGGFLWGFIVFAALCGAAYACKNKYMAALLSFSGLLLCHFIGAVQFALVTHTGLWQAALVASVPYLLKDALSRGRLFHRIGSQKSPKVVLLKNIAAVRKACIMDADKHIRRTAMQSFNGFLEAAPKVLQKLIVTNNAQTPGSASTLLRAAARRLRNFAAR